MPKMVEKLYILAIKAIYKHMGDNAEWRNDTNTMQWIQNIFNLPNPVIPCLVYKAIWGIHYIVRASWRLETQYNGRTVDILDVINDGHMRQLQGD